MNEKDRIIKDFKDLYENAKREYPDIDDSISEYNNIIAETIDYQEFLNLTTQKPNEVSNNQIES